MPRAASNAGRPALMAVVLLPAATAGADARSAAAPVAAPDRAMN
jgi:hypothetical protein